jgi:hypothetical protein
MDGLREQKLVKTIEISKNSLFKSKYRRVIALSSSIIQKKAA